MGTMHRVRRVGAVAALGAILACSALGLCWREFVTTSHDCCKEQTASAPAKSCASAVTSVTPFGLAAPLAATLHEGPSLESLEHPLALFAATRPAKSPPLVLRI